MELPSPAALSSHARSTSADYLEDVFRREFLIERPLLRAISGDAKPPLRPADRRDRPRRRRVRGVPARAALGLPDLHPELGTITAQRTPVVVVTSNRTREIHDALKRRCLYAWIDYPTFEKELAIVRRKVPEADARLAEQVCHFTQVLRGLTSISSPGVSETLDWAQALVLLARQELDESTVTATIGCLVKYQEEPPIAPARRR